MAFNSETVAPWSGKTEDIIVFSILAAILAISSTLLHLFYPSEQNHGEVTPQALRQSLVALSNAAEEIVMHEEFMGTRPNLDTLIEMKLSPFSENEFDNMTKLRWQQDSHCFIAETTDLTPPYQIKLHFSAKEPSAPPEISWRIANENSPLSVANCQKTHNSNWQRIRKSQPDAKDAHKH
ncbi:hypothetical protein A9Q81_17390 [Gammaproteobacteria bacterium 42_54_T18]|nr:hypothetical protein A9Q81_17390 [Gammaproteobacteria bacterium 42_54_T18]